VENQRVEVRTQPDGGAYLRQETVPSGGELQSSSLPELKVSVDRIFAG
jgi:Uma2 family endonuclease